MKQLKTICIITAIMAASNDIHAQGVAINTTGASADPSAMLDVSSTSRGMLAPRMNNSQRDAISSPATGLLIYQTDGTAGFYYYTGSAWQALSSGTSGSGPWTLTGVDIHNNNSGRVGVGTTTPAARFHVADSNVVFTATGTVPGTPGLPPVSGAGRRLMWYPDRSAIRAGYVSGTQWDKDSVGKYSTAFGFNNIAKGSNAFAAGGTNHAFGDNSVTIGNFDTASATSATAIGRWALASGLQSISLGTNTKATGANSLAMGNATRATGASATSMGKNSLASGTNSTAMGNTTIADGANSTAIGNYVGTGTFAGAVAIGDNSTGTTATYNDANDQMMMRFAGGYKLYNNSSATTGLELTPGGSAKYMTNVGSTFVDRSLVDKRYVDSLLGTVGSDTTWATSGADIYNANTRNVGIGTSTPAARLHVADSSVVFTGFDDPWAVADPAQPPVSGRGSRMMWYADKTAFRAGSVDADQWDKDSIGYLSTAMGYNTTAIGGTSTAMGNSTTASGQSATAMGMHTTASGYNGSTAMGWNTTASGGTATAMGVETIASGEWATAMGSFSQATGEGSTAIGVGAIASGQYANAMGYSTTASGFNATAMCHHTTASGRHAIAMGYYTTASGDNSVATGAYTTASGNSATAMGIWTTASAGGAGGATAMGYGTIANGVYSTAMGTQVSTNGRTGAFAIGDKPPTTSSITYNDADNQMLMRFAGGYKLYSNSTATIGTQLAPGANSWSTISDVRKKENFEPVNGDEFLKKIAQFKLTSWNYKGQDAKLFRHYGPMAQDFYAAFGTDSYGTIGNDTTIGQADMEGVSFVAIQALERRTREQQKEIDELKAENALLKSRSEKVADITGRLEAVEASLNINKRISKK
jgi:hypothetical protein